MRRILIILTVAALFVLAMTYAGIAFGQDDPQCQSGGNKHCVETNPGDQTKGCTNNQNCDSNFTGG